MTTRIIGSGPSYDLERFNQRVIVKGEDDCWPWLGATNGMANPYPHFTISGRRKVYAHRWAYETFVGRPIPDGFQIDHLCRNTLCVNPGHLEPVTLRENARRGSKAQSVKCKHGHPFDAANTYWRPGSRGGRDCRECRRRIDRERKHRRTEEPTT